MSSVTQTVPRPGSLAWGDPMSVVDIRPLKQFAEKKMLGCPFARQLVTTEADELRAEDFLIKVSVWLRLVKLEQQARQLV